MRNCCKWSRRKFMQTAAAGLAAAPILRGQTEAPTSPVAIARCPEGYNEKVYDAMVTMFDQLGGLGKLVNGKTVAIKINLTGPADYRLDGMAPERAHWTHWGIIGTLVYMMGYEGARRIRLLESCGDTSGPMEDFMVKAGWDPSYFTSLAPLVEFENTNNIGYGDHYSRFTVPTGGYLFPGFDLNHSYEDCDVFVSMAKLKQHWLAGITLSMKNCFGSLPLTIYGTDAGVNEPGFSTSGFRGEVMHEGIVRKPSLSAPQELDPTTPRDPGYRLPRVVTDIVSARPIHLSIIDGIETMTGGEGPWNPDVKLVQPWVLIAGYNPVCTDAVGAAVMGFDPMAQGYTPAFRQADNILELGEAAGIGTRDLSRIEVLGEPIESVRFPYPYLAPR
jgi:uncharacterized protein (DUF362 family)